MNVEGGLSGGGSIGAAPVSGLARMDSGPAFGAAPTVTGPVNEGPLSLAALKLTVPLSEPSENSAILNVSMSENQVVGFSDAQIFRQDLFSVIPNTFTAFSVNSVRNLSRMRGPNELGDSSPRTVWYRAQNDKMIEPVIVSFPVPHVLEYSKPEAVVSPAVEPAAEPAVRTSTKTENAVAAQATEVETSTERVINQQIDTVGEEKIIKKKKFVVDQPTLANRLQKVVEAVRQAKPEAKRLGLGNKIIGWIVDKYLLLSHPAYMSKVVQPEGPDGTIAITEETIKAKAEFESEQEVESVVLDNIPVSEEEDGEPVSDEQVRKVFQDRIVKPSKPGRPLELVEKRVVQKEQKSLS